MRAMRTLGFQDENVTWRWWEHEILGFWKWESQRILLRLELRILPVNNGCLQCSLKAEKTEREGRGDWDFKKDFCNVKLKALLWGWWRKIIFLTPDLAMHEDWESPSWADWLAGLGNWVRFGKICTGPTVTFLHFLLVCCRHHLCGVRRSEACAWNPCAGEFGTLQGRKDW